MTQGLMALGGVIVGLLISEYFRRRARQESYASVVFGKRLAAYETFDKKINQLNDLAARLVNEAAPLAERQASWGLAIEEFGDFIFDNRLYLSADVVTHASATLAGVYAILASTEPSKQAEMYNRNLKLLREMIRSDSGAQQSESLLRWIFKARKHRSEYLDNWKNRGPW